LSSTFEILCAVNHYVELAGRTIYKRGLEAAPLHIKGTDLERLQPADHILISVDDPL